MLKHFITLQSESSPIGMLQPMGQNEGAAELACSSHVQHLLSKMPADLVASFIRYHC